MKKTHTVNIGGMVFSVDEDAYQRLYAYLNAIEAHFRKDEERKEIMDDVEGRIAELFRKKITSYHQVVTLDDVNEVIGILGKPDDFSQDGSGTSEGYTAPEGMSYRRMYRDPDHRILGGVCAGMGAYWHIDPVIIRILFLIAFFGFGIGVLVYLLLWIVIPEARTTAEKLEMRGEPVTFENIGRFVREEFGQVKKNIRL